MSKVTLFSLHRTKIAYPSASFTTPDMRSMLGLYAFGGSTSSVTASVGYVEASDAAAYTLEVRDE